MQRERLGPTDLPYRLLNCAACDSSLGERTIMPLLDEDAYRRTFGEKMHRVESDDAPFPFWAYVDQIPPEDFQGYDCSEGSVQWVWRSNDGRFEHILIDSKEDKKEDKDVFIVIVLDLGKMKIVGHRLMDFKREYGLRER